VGQVDCSWKAGKGNYSTTLKNPSPYLLQFFLHGLLLLFRFSSLLLLVLPISIHGKPQKLKLLAITTSFNFLLEGTQTCKLE